MYFSVRTHSHSRTVNRWQLQIFSIPNISQVSATHRQWPQIAFLIIHTARLSLAWTSTDLPSMSGICRQFIKTWRRVKNRAKIVQCELGISVTETEDPRIKQSIFHCFSYLLHHCIIPISRAVARNSGPCVQNLLWGPSNVWGGGSCNHKMLNKVQGWWLDTGVKMPWTNPAHPAQIIPPWKFWWVIGC